MPNTTYGTPYAQSSDLVSNWPGVSSNVADRIDDVSFKGNGLNDQTGTSYTLVLTDAGKTVTLNNAAAVTVTIPTNASVAYETGTTIGLTNKGAGVVTVSPAGGVTLNNSVTLAQNATVSIQKLDTNTWVMVSAPTPGLTFITSSTFSAASAVNVNSCFSSTYDNYRIIINITSQPVTATIMFRMRASGTDNSSSNYYYNGLQLGTSSASTFVTSRSSGLATSYFINLYKGNPGSAVIDIFAPQLSEVTRMVSQSITIADTDMQMEVLAGRLSVTTSYDGFSLVTTSGTITGNVRIYGYRNS